jgi:hypothetical protein
VVGKKEKYLVAAQKFIERGQLDKALAEFSRVVEDDPKDTRTWLKMAELFAEFYKCKLDVTLFRTPEEVTAITAALNVDAAHGGGAAGARGGSSSSDDTPLAMAASRIIVYSLVFGL